MEEVHHLEEEVEEVEEVHHLEEKVEEVYHQEVEVVEEARVLLPLEE